MARKPLILVVDDDPKTVDVVRLYLEDAGCDVAVAYDGPTALIVARSERRPDLVVLDWMLPGLDGLEVCRRLREEAAVPIIMLTARSTEEDRLEGLDLGADDYVVKPFSPRELAARVRAVLRRALPEDDGPVRAGPLSIDPARHEVTADGRTVRVTPGEFRLLAVLAHSPGRTFSRAALVEQAFGDDSDALERTIDVHVANLRRKLGHHANLIETVYGVGYRLAVERRAV
jgi:DNA-binding response OmpR family regulator